MSRVLLYEVRRSVRCRFARDLHMSAMVVAIASNTSTLLVHFFGHCWSLIIYTGACVNVNEIMYKTS
jgi:hypothetical protein